MEFQNLFLMSGVIRIFFDKKVCNKMLLILVLNFVQ